MLILAGSLEGGGTISKETTKNIENDLSVVKEKSRKRVFLRASRKKVAPTISSEIHVVLRPPEL